MIELIKKWLVAKRTHILVWAIFIAFEITMIGLSVGAWGNPPTYAAHYLVLISFFYVHGERVMPKINRQPRYIVWRMLLVIPIEMLVYMVVCYGVDVLLTMMDARSTPTVLLSVPYLVRNLYRGFYFIFGGTGYYYIITYIEEKKRSAELETQRLQEIINRRIAEDEAIRSQNAFLVAQINPHFLFNTLDYLYHNLLSLDSKLADAVISLSGMMRFAIDADKMGNTIRLGDEVEQVENLIYLHQVRQKLQVELRVDEQATELPIIPLVLLTLTENAFKHGNLRDNVETARIEIYIENEHLHIQTVNTINHTAARNSSLTGLSNIRKRLEVAYSQRFSFTYGPTEANTFRVHLSIELAALEKANEFSYSSITI
ncbi:histidine kinase [Mucilaginibacter yixingensis]|uniref:Histidine kinase n=1 Tax=Mucilaginibacter yixingensis TaxID=1295612 RepID=A0A2T5JAL4_9SPHI|nr:histidine kinase [Mucilaginibacter yixingensis]PTQ97912.1 histidine kinase [Mucilaginibacter yixingensis]